MTIEPKKLISRRTWCVLALLVAVFGSVRGFADDSDAEVEIPDPILREEIERRLGKAPGDAITRGEMKTLEEVVVTRHVDQLDGIEYAINLRVLKLTHGWILDVSPLAELSSLTILDLSYNRISDVSPLAGLSSLASLDLSYNSLTDVSPLAGLSSLNSLDLSGNAVSSNVSALGGLVSLTALELSRCAISDLSSLGGLTSLTRLGLSGNVLKDLSSLAALSSLMSVDLSDNAISDLSPLAALSSLTILDLSYNEVSSVGALAGLVSLTALKLSGNWVSDLSPLARLAQLRKLDLSGNRVEDISVLARMTLLTELDLSSNLVVTSSNIHGDVVLSFTDVSPLAGLSALTMLNLSGNGITDVSALSGLVSLTELDLSSNQVEDISPLVENEGLDQGDLVDLATNPMGRASLDVYVPQLRQRLVLVKVTEFVDIPDPAVRQAVENVVKHLGWLGPGHPIPYHIMARIREIYVDPESEPHDLAGLEFAVDLEYLFAPPGSISSIVPLGNAPLTGLRLAGNEVSDVSPLAGRVSLTSIDLTDNAVSDVSPLAGLTELTYLLLSGNEISDVTALAGLRALGHLELSGNKISDVSPLAGLWALTYLDLSDNEISDISPLRSLQALTTLDLSSNQISWVGYAYSAAGDTLWSIASRWIRGEVSGVLFRPDIKLSGNPLGLHALYDILPRLKRLGVVVTYSAPKDYLSYDDPPDQQLRGAVERTIEQGAQGTSIRTLRKLDASNRGIESLEGLEQLELIDTLFLDRNRIYDISPLVGHRLLRTLTLAHNIVEDWGPLTEMDLEFLALDANSIRELPTLPVGLRSLSLTDNSISDISALNTLWRLSELRANGNAITSLEALSGRALHYLHAEDNQISDLSPLNFVSLQDLLLRNNRVRDISPLLHGEGLRLVDVRRNPLADGALAVLETLRKRTRAVTVLAGETVPYFPSANNGRQGLVRIVNRSDEDGHVFIEAVDDGGVRKGPVRLEVGAQQAVHFNSTDLESGNAAKGLGSGIGQPTAGGWRLSVLSALDVEVLSYVQTRDGFVAAMHDVVPDAVVPFFKTGEQRQRNILRVVNTEAEPAKWTTGGYDDRGNWRLLNGSMLVRAGARAHAHRRSAGKYARSGRRWRKLAVACTRLPLVCDEPSGRP